MELSKQTVGKKGGVFSLFTHFIEGNVICIKGYLAIITIKINKQTCSLLGLKIRVYV